MGDKLQEKLSKTQQKLRAMQQKRGDAAPAAAAAAADERSRAAPSGGAAAAGAAAAPAPVPLGDLDPSALVRELLVGAQVYVQAPSSTDELQAQLAVLKLHRAAVDRRVQQLEAALAAAQSQPA